jgi:hypothetical protein
LEDGVVIYSVGPNGVDDDGVSIRYGPKEKDPLDYGFRLWDPDKRHQPPAPKAVPKDEKGEGNKALPWSEPGRASFSCAPGGRHHG